MYDLLNLGCGSRPLKNAVNMDICDYSYLNIGKFVKGDFNKKLPFENECFSKVIMERSLEHCKDIWFTLHEVKRVLKKKGVLIAKVPYFRFPYAFSPLTHYYYFTYRSLDSLDEEYHLFKVKKRIKFYTHKRIMKYITFPFETVFNWIPVIYEISILSVLFPAPEIEFHLTKI